MKKYIAHIAAFIAVLVACSNVQAASVTVESTFTGGLFGNFSIEYDSSSPGVKLQSLTFDLVSPLFLDPTFTSPGFTLPLPFSATTGAAATGYLGATGTTDGSSSFTLLFSDFDSGEVFNFNLDVDQWPCGGFLCLPGSITFGSEFAGTKLSGEFGGSGFETISLNALFSTTGSLTAEASMSGDVSPVPEPATVGLLALSFLLFALRRGLVRRRA